VKQRHCLQRGAIVCASAITFGALTLSDVAAEEAGESRKPFVVVITGGRVVVPSFEQPYSADVVNREQIANGQWRVNASEALGPVPGVVVQNRNNYAQDLQISSRGFGTRASFGVRGVKLLTDGIPATMPDGQGQAATFNLDTAGRIEVLRGPTATMYGNHAGGVIQLFSRTPNDTPTVSSRATLGSFDTWKINLGAEGRREDTSYLVDLSRFSTDGYRDHSAATRDQGFAKLAMQSTAGAELTFIGGFLDQDGTQDPLGLTWSTFESDPTAVESRALEYNTRKNLHHQQGGMAYRRRFERGTLETQLYMGQRSITQFLAIPTFVQAGPNSSGGVVDFDRDFMGLGARWISDRDLAEGGLTLVAGIDVDRSRDERRGYENFIGTTKGVIGALRREETDTVTSVDPYLQATWNRGRWTWMGGLRSSRVEFDVEDAYFANGDDSGSRRYSETTPALGVSYEAAPAVRVYASAGKGFETPTFSELSHATPTTGFNFDLQPATTQQYELGVKALLGKATRLNAALFQVRSKNEIVVSDSSGGRTSYQNAGRTLRDGVELALHSPLTDTLTLRTALTYMQATYDEAFVSRGNVIPAGNRLPGVPETSLYTELSWKPSKGMTGAIEGVYRDKVYVEDTNAEQAAPSYFIANIRFTAEQQRGEWTFQQMFRVDNLFDKKYVGSVIVADRNGRYYEPGSGRGWYVGAGISYQFQ